MPAEETPPNIDQAIADILIDGKSTNVDGTVTVNHSIPDLIAADEFYRRRANRTARAANPRRSPFGNVRQISPPAPNGI